MRPTVLTLSSIPSRFHRISDAISAVTSQDLPIDEVRLVIPLRYRRFPDWDGTLPDVPKGVRIVRTETDLGPATKVLPTARDLRGQDVDILFCDDDRLVDRGWHRRIKTAAMERPGHAICTIGETFPDISDAARPPDRLPRAHRTRKGLRYRWRRVVTLGRYKEVVYCGDGYVDQVSGYGGVLVRPDWFDDECWNIPEILWTVDDPWLSGHLARAGIPIWLTQNPAGWIAHGIGSKVDALLNLVEQGYDRVDADVAAIQYMRETYGVWLPAGDAEPFNKRWTESMQALWSLRTGRPVPPRYSQIDQSRR